MENYGDETPLYFIMFSIVLASIVRSFENSTH